MPTRLRLPLVLVLLAAAAAPPASAAAASSTQTAPLTRWLAAQIGPVARPSGTAGAARMQAAGEGAAVLSAAGAAHPLRLVRSYRIPAGDPSAARLANWSWTYDSAVTAIAFTATGDRHDAATLLDQLAALQTPAARSRPPSTSSRARARALSARAPSPGSAWPRPRTTTASRARATAPSPSGRPPISWRSAARTGSCRAAPT